MRAPEIAIAVDLDSGLAGGAGRPTAWGLRPVVRLLKITADYNVDRIVPAADGTLAKDDRLPTTQQAELQRTLLVEALSTSRGSRHALRGQLRRSRGPQCTAPSSRSATTRPLRSVGLQPIVVPAAAPIPRGSTASTPTRHAPPHRLQPRDGHDRKDGGPAPRQGLRITSVERRLARMISPGFPGDSPIGLATTRVHSRST